MQYVKHWKAGKIILKHKASYMEGVKNDEKEYYGI